MSNLNINKKDMLPVGSILKGTYRIERYLSSGGFGNTYVAVHVGFRETVAIKEFFMKGVTHRDSDGTTVGVSNRDNETVFGEQLEKFRKEARRLRILRNNHIVAVHDLFDENGTAYYVMDYIDGESLASRLRRLGHPLSEEEVMGYLPQMLDALECAHHEGFLHLDLKPANVMLDKEGQIRLIDFGASKQLSQNGGASATSSISYTKGYAPREQMEENLEKFGPWTDLYALGATLYNLLTNSKPTLPSNIDDDFSPDKHIALPFPENVSESTRNLVLRFMTTNRMRRPQSVEEVWKMIRGDEKPPRKEDTDDDTTEVIVNETPPVSLQKASWKKYLYGILGLVAAVCLLVVIVNSFTSSSSRQDTSEVVVDSDRYGIASRLSEDLESKSSSHFNETLRYFDGWIDKELTGNQKLIIREVTEARVFMIEHKADISSALGHSTETMDWLKSYTDRTVKEIVDERAKRVGVEVPADLYENKMYKSEQRIW